jgi:hypothetical protein
MCFMQNIFKKITYFQQNNWNFKLWTPLLKKIIFYEHFFIQKLVYSRHENIWENYFLLTYLWETHGMWLSPPSLLTRSPPPAAHPPSPPLWYQFSTLSALSRSCLLSQASLYFSLFYFFYRTGCMCTGLFVWATVFRFDIFCFIFLYPSLLFLRFQKRPLVRVSNFSTFLWSNVTPLVT